VASSSSRTGSRRRTSSSFVLGGLAGLLAAVTTVPVLMPLTSRLQWAERQAAIESVRNQALMLALTDREEQSQDAPPWMDDVCDGRGHVEPDARDLTVWACATGASGRPYTVTTTLPASPESLGSLFVLALAAIVGLSTALGTLQLLSPLNRLPTALQQMARGQRMKPIAHTGLREIDDLIDRINATAHATQEREEAIRGRVAIVQQLARIVAHELRNPLQAMEFMAEVLKGEEDEEERRVVASDLQKEIRSLDGVVTQMLSAPEATALRLHRTASRADEPVERAVRLRQPDANAAEVEIQAVIKARDEVHMDLTLVTRALENLVANAVAFAPRSRGRVRVEVSRDDHHIRYVVDDNGPGVPEAMREAVFQSKYTTRPGGHGLGLVLVAGVARAHGGRVEVSTSPLGGARFELSLPLSPPAGIEGAP